MGGRGGARPGRHSGAPGAARAVREPGGHAVRPGHPWRRPRGAGDVHRRKAVVVSPGAGCPAGRFGSGGASRPSSPVDGIRDRSRTSHETIPRNSMDSRLRGNDIPGVFAVIPAQAGIHTALTEHECGGWRRGGGDDGVGGTPCGFIRTFRGIPWTPGRDVSCGGGGRCGILGDGGGCTACGSSEARAEHAVPLAGGGGRWAGGIARRGERDAIRPRRRGCMARGSVAERGRLSGEVTT